ncbi:MAG: hypothetical protein JW699_08180 [Chitinispirillaceae bacterium]|nr:hypothetical protein [Chitinispirillaceae bacterium]
MDTTLREVTTAKDRKTFIYLPEKIHRAHSGWLPPLYSDEKKYFDPDINPSFRSCDYRMVLAYKNGRPVGRIVGIIHRKHNEMMGLKNARFGFLECYNDREAAHALISDIETWGKQRGMNRVVGPFGFSDRDIQGLLIEGFEYEPVVDSACNFEYLPELVTKEGYVKDIDCVIRRHPLDEPLPEIFDRIYTRVVAKKAFRFLEFTSRKEMKHFIVPVLQMVNEAFGGIYGFVPMDETEMVDLAKRYLPILDPKFVKIVTKDGKVVAFMVSMPNCWRGLQKAKGRLFPLGIFHVLHAMKHAESINTMLGAVHPDYQKQGLDIFLGLSTVATAKKMGMKNMDSHVVMEDNPGMNDVFQRYNARLIKRFRVYKKDLQ